MVFVFRSALSLFTKSDTHCVCVCELPLSRVALSGMAGGGVAARGAVAAAAAATLALKCARSQNARVSKSDASGVMVVQGEGWLCRGAGMGMGMGKKVVQFVCVCCVRVVRREGGSARARPLALLRCAPRSAPHRERDRERGGRKKCARSARPESSL